MNTLESNCQQVSIAIAGRIARSAFWHDGRCNWIGAQSGQSLGTYAANGTTYRTLNADLYSGTAGVALFLAEAAAITEDQLFCDTALGAIRHALSQAEAMPAHVRLSLFNGLLGVLLVAVRIANRLDYSPLRSEAITLLNQCRREHGDFVEFDLMGGEAGSIIALLALAQMLRRPALVKWAEQLGHCLIRKANKIEQGWSWSSPSLKTRRNLTGLSHGAAGCGFAFFELYAATGKESFRDAGRAAFQYESSCFDVEASNWPDFRHRSAQPRGSRPQCLSFWCHGAPGIAMARLRALELLQEEAYRCDALTALRTTAESVKAAIDEASGNFSLCHGLAGNGEALHYGLNILGSSAACGTLLSQLANYGQERFANTDAPWPCGTHCGETPNLMLGLAGIGHFYLRLAHPAVPSVLLLRKEAWI